MKPNQNQKRAGGKLRLVFFGLPFHSENEAVCSSGTSGFLLKCGVATHKTVAVRTEICPDYIYCFEIRGAGPVMNTVFAGRMTDA
jgi:hypothetical protein